MKMKNILGIYIVFTWLTKFTGSEDDIVQIISNLYFQRFKFGDNLTNMAEYLLKKLGPLNYLK